MDRAKALRGALRKRKDLRSVRIRASGLFLVQTASNKKASPGGEVALRSDDGEGLRQARVKTATHSQSP